MTAGLYDQTVHLNAQSWLHAVQEHMREHLIRPMIVALIERCWADGTLPLPPLGWGRAEPWFVGDLR